MRVSARIMIPASFPHELPHGGQFVPRNTGYAATLPSWTGSLQIVDAKGRRWHSVRSGHGTEYRHQLIGVQGVASSNLAVPTNLFNHLASPRLYAKNGGA